MSKTVWIINHYALTPAQGGLNRHFYLAEELQARGYKVHIFTSSAIHNSSINMIDKNEKSFFKDTEYQGVPYTYLRSNSYTGNGLSRIKNMLGFAYGIKKIWKKYAWENPDLIYASSPDIFTAWKAEKFAKKHKLPCMVEVRDLWPLSIVEYKNTSERNPIICALYGLEKKIYARADSLVFTMAGGKEYICDKKWDKKISLDKVFHINNGIDIAEQEKQREENILDDVDLTDDTFKVVYAGSIRHANCVELIVKAAQILQENEKIKFLLYGDGDERAALEKFCADNRLTNVIFKGKVDKKYIPYICSKANLNVVSVKKTNVSKYGVSWNKLFDYMHARRPILSTVSVKYDLIQKHDCGISLIDQSPQAIADAVLQINNLPKEKYDQMCANAESGAKDYDYSILTNKLENAMGYALKQYGEKK